MRKKVVVIGGGPAGMEAAIIARKRGHDVTLFEKGDPLGGQLLIASAAPCKAEMAECLRHLRHELTLTGVEVLLGKAPDPGEILDLRPDAVIIATGSRPLLPDIPGVHLPFVQDARAVYKRPEVIESPVARGILYEDGRREFELRYVARALEVADGSVSAAAERIGLHRNTLRRKIVEYRLKVRR